jgi:hypothetical protein
MGETAMYLFNEMPKWSRSLFKMEGYRPQVDFSGEGEQYDPANIHVHNIWVVVGAKDGDRLTTFMLHE